MNEGISSQDMATEIGTHSYRQRLRFWLERLIEQKWINAGLRTKLTLMVITGLAGLLTTFAFLGISAAQQVTRQALGERVMLSRMVANSLDITFSHTRSHLTSLASQPGLNSIAEDLDLQQDLLREAQAFGQPYILLNGAGEVIFSTRPDLPEIQWSKTAAIKAALAGKNFSLSALSLAPQTHEPGVTWVAAAVAAHNQSAQDGSVTPVIITTIFSLSDPAFQLFDRSFALGQTGVIDVVDATGVILISTHPNSQNGLPYLPNILDQFFVAGEPGVETCLGCSGAEAPDSDEVVAFAPLKQAPWGVIIRQKAREVFSPVRRLALLTLGLGLITVTGALMLVMITANSVIRPVQQLTAAARRMASGDLDAPLPWTKEEKTSSSRWNLPFFSWLGRRDEIGELAVSFAAMHTQLQSSIQEIQRWNRELDARVRERTETALAAQEEAQAARDDLRKVVDVLVQRNRQLSILNAIGNTVNQSLDLQEILEKALEEVLSLTGIDVGAVFLMDEAAGRLELIASRGLSPEAARYASEVGMLDSSCGGVMERGQVVIVPDLNRYHGKRAKSLQRDHLNTLVHVPLTAKGCTLGSMCIATHDSRSFGSEEQEMLTAIGNQIAVAIENARLYAVVQQKERLRGELFKKAINAQEDERKRIARELHDDTCQALTALIFAAEEGLEMPRLDEVKSHLEEMRELSQHSLDGVHKMIFDLRPSMLDHLGLGPALRWFAEARLEPRGIRVEVIEAHPLDRLPAEMETALFRVGQEAVTNIARHSAARNVIIRLDSDGKTVHLSLEDDGIGFDLSGIIPTPDSLRGLGLIGMQERVEALGGALEVISAPGIGTRISIEAPTEFGKPIYA